MALHTAGLLLLESRNKQTNKHIKKSSDKDGKDLASSDLDTPVSHSLPSLVLSPALLAHYTTICYKGLQRVRPVDSSLDLLAEAQALVSQVCCSGGITTITHGNTTPEGLLFKEVKYPIQYSANHIGRAPLAPCVCCSPGARPVSPVLPGMVG